MKALFAATLLVSSALLFVVQPMFGKMLLPYVGSTPATWTTCMMFFQAALLLGYAYAHALRVPPAVHVLLLVLPLLALPIAVMAGSTPQAGSNPTLWILAQLAVAVGAPFLALSASAPLLQRWFPGDPYALYAASNVGSLLALVAYPTLIEPRLPLLAQGRWFAAGYLLFVAMTACCVFVARKHVPVWRWLPRAEAPEARDAPQPISEASLGMVKDVRAKWRRFARWVLLAFVPSSLTIGATTYISTDIAAMPLFWVVPLGLYLISFIVVFARPPAQPALISVTAYKVLMVPLFVFSLQAVTPSLGMLIGHLLFVLLAALIFHGELVRTRPARSDLTQFYLALAVGGALGGLFNSLGPLLFARITEYPVTMALGCLLLPLAPQLSHAAAAAAREKALLRSVGIDPAAVAGLAPDALPGRHRMLNLGVPVGAGLVTLGLGWLLRDAPTGARVLVVFAAPTVASALLSIRQSVRLGSALFAVLIAFGLGSGDAGDVLWQGRSFFATLRVEDTPATEATGAGPGQERVRQLIHGTIVHGQQSLDPALRREPIGYYYRRGPVGQIFAVLRAKRAGQPATIAVIGLGTGALAAYGEAGDHFTFFEIDAMVERIARDPRLFTWLADTAAKVTVVLGDGRLAMARSAGSYDLILADAFSSDAIPMHLMTREALTLYLSRLAPHGLVAFHISNRYLELAPALGALASDAHLAILTRLNLDADPPLKLASKWVVLARAPSDLAAFAGGDSQWTEVPTGGAAWTDDFSNLLSALHW